MTSATTSTKESPSRVTTAATASLTGQLALQGRQAALGLEWWSAEAGVALEIGDDAGSASAAAAAYGRWLDAGIDILFGPYGSGLVRSVVPLVTGAGAMLWNHGGSADDLAHPLVVPIPSPASTYFRGAVQLAAYSGLEEIVLVVGRGSFAASVAAGAVAAATHIGVPVREIPMAEARVITAATPVGAVMVVGTFEEDVAFVAELGADYPGLIACVAAGLLEFGERLGPAAEGVLGPVQWIPEAVTPELGPSGTEFARRYQAMFGSPPGYVAAQAAAAGFLAAEAHRLGLRPEDVRRWRTSTLLGSFAVDKSWRQIGYTARTVRWQGGRQVLVP